MHFSQLRLPAVAALLGGGAARAAFPTLARQSGNVLAASKLVEGHRFAAVKAQGAYRVTNKKTLPKKLGAKRVGDQYVLPGTIIYKQRGTIWHDGENTILGRDHTIHSAIAGFVKYYRDPAKHPDRQYIGVTYDRDDVLPYSLNAPRKRKLGLTAVPRKAGGTFELMSRSGIPRRIVRKPGVVVLDSAEEPPIDPKAVAVEAAEAAAADKPAAAAADGKDGKDSKKKDTKASRAARRWNAYVRTRRETRTLYLAKNYSYQESNFQIGRLMGTHKGKTAGTQRYGSRRAVLRHRRNKKEGQLKQARDLKRQESEFALEMAQAVKAKAAKKAGDAKKSKKASKVAK